MARALIRRAWTVRRSDRPREPRRGRTGRTISPLLVPTSDIGTCIRCWSEWRASPPRDFDLTQHAILRDKLEYRPETRERYTPRDRAGRRFAARCWRFSATARRGESAARSAPCGGSTSKVAPVKVSVPAAAKTAPREATEIYKELRARRPSRLGGHFGKRSRRRTSSAALRSPSNHPTLETHGDAAERDTLTAPGPGRRAVQRVTDLHATRPSETSHEVTAGFRDRRAKHESAPRPCLLQKRLRGGSGPGAPLRSTSRSPRRTGPSAHRLLAPGRAVKYAMFFHGEDAVADALSPSSTRHRARSQKYFRSAACVRGAHAVFFSRFMHEVVERATAPSPARSRDAPGAHVGLREDVRDAPPRGRRAAP